MLKILIGGHKGGSPDFYFSGPYCGFCDIYILADPEADTWGVFVSSQYLGISCLKSISMKSSITIKEIPGYTVSSCRPGLQQE